jgi:hypothetical protein
MNTLTRGSLLLGALALSTVAYAQGEALGEVPSQARFGDYTIYYSAVRASALPESMLRKYSLPPPSEDAILLNVAVQLAGTNVPAEIEARVTNLAEETHSVEMHPTEANAMVSYLGVVEISAPGVLTFDLEIRPRASLRPFHVEFRRSFEAAPSENDQGNVDDEEDGSLDR